MKPATQNLIQAAIEKFATTTGFKAVHQYKRVNKTRYPEGIIRIVHQDQKWTFAANPQPRVNRATVTLAALQQIQHNQDYIMITNYMTPPLAERMRENGLLFMDTAGNAYINKPPLYIFIKGNRIAKTQATQPTKRFLKTAGLKVVFALLNDPNMINRPYREIAAAANVALGTVDWIINDLKEMGFVLDMGKRRRLLQDTMTLLQRWVEAYPDQLRPKLVLERFTARDPKWWHKVNIIDFKACWGGEVAAAKLTKRLRPEKIVIYANQLPGKLIVQKKLRKAVHGDIEILKPFWNDEPQDIARGTAPPLVIYADLMATGDDRNIETAGIIYDQYLAQLGRQD